MSATLDREQRRKQAVGGAFNIVLFRKAARVESMTVPEGTEISATTGRWAEDGWVEDYEVLEKVPSFHGEVDTNGQESGWLDFPAMSEAMPVDVRDADWRDDSLRIVPESVQVHRVKRVELATDAFTVKRHRRKKRDSIDCQAGP